MSEGEPFKGRGKRLSYGIYWGPALALCLAGLTVSVYLSVSHFRVHTDPSYQSFCALSKAINCDTVSQSPWSIWYGIPLALWGVALYGLLTVLVLFSAASSGERRRVWTIIFSAALLSSLASVWFAGLSTFVIGSWCVLCIATYGVNFLLMFLSWIIRRRFQSEPFTSAFKRDLRFLRENIRWAGTVLGLPALGLVAAILWFPAYWEIEAPGPSAHIRTGLTEEGLPWIGAEHPIIEIVEFTDYQCFQCRKMHRFLLELLALYPERIRVIHRHFPMDHEINPIVGEPFHVGSGRMATLAIHAALRGKFPEMNDWLFFKADLEQGRLRLAEAAEATGIDAAELAAALTHDPYRLLLKRDIHEGLRLGVVGTPSYFINGKVYEGSLPAEVLEPVFQTAGVK